MRCAIPLCVVTLSCLTALGQNPRPEFEVASIKPSPPPEDERATMMLKAQNNLRDNMRGFVPLKGDTVTLRGYSLLHLVAAAYRALPREMTAPAWMADARFDIEAKIPQGAAKGTTNEMLQKLLEDRFALQIHRETRSVPGYALVATKGGAHLPSGTEGGGAKPDADEMQKRMQSMREKMKAQGVQSWSTWSSSDADGAKIAAGVAGMVHAPVADETGITGKHAIELEVPGPETPDEPVEYRVSRALAKYGLKLESRKNQVEFVVVDSVSKTPTEN